MVGTARSGPPFGGAPPRRRRDDLRAVRRDRGRGRSSIGIAIDRIDAASRTRLVAARRSVSAARSRRARCCSSALLAALLALRRRRAASRAVRCASPEPAHRPTAKPSTRVAASKTSRSPSGSARRRSSCVDDKAINGFAAGRNGVVRASASRPARSRLPHDQLDSALRADDHVGREPRAAAHVRGRRSRRRRAGLHQGRLGGDRPRCSSRRSSACRSRSRRPRRSRSCCSSCCTMPLLTLADRAIPRPAGPVRRSWPISTRSSSRTNRRALARLLLATAADHRDRADAVADHAPLVRPRHQTTALIEHVRLRRSDLFGDPDARDARRHRAARVATARITCSSSARECSVAIDVG